MVTVYRRQGQVYGRPEIHELDGVLGAAALPNVRVDWERVLARASPAA